MKTTTAFYLLIIYSLALCKPVLPLVKDVLAHAFWKAQHVATVHHHHGARHAHHEVAKATQQEDGDKLPTSSKTAEPVSPHVIETSGQGEIYLLIEEKVFGSRTYSTSGVALDKNYPPPRFC